MARRIYIDTDTYAFIAKRLEDLSNELSDCSSSLSRVNTSREAGGNLRVNLSGRLSRTGAAMPDGRIDSVIRSMQRVINGLSNYSDALANQVNKASNLFETTERKLARLQYTPSEVAVYSQKSGNMTEQAKKLINLASAYFLPGVHQVLGPGSMLSSIWENAQVIMDGPFSAVILPGLSMLFADEMPIASLFNDGNTQGLGNYAPIIGMSPEQIQEFFKTNSYAADLNDILSGGKGELKFDLTDGTMEGRMNILGISAEKGVSKSVWGAEGSYENGNFTADGNVDFLKGEANASFNAGLYVEVTDADGNVKTKFAPGLNAKAGASFTAFEASGSANYEIVDNLSVGVEGKVTAGKVGAEAEVQIGYNDEGHIEISAGAEAEAIAGEIEGSAKINVAGVEGKVTGTLNYGVGAKAKAAVSTEGVITVDLGLTIGVGASVSFEIDAGEAIENISNTMDYIGDSAKGFAESVWNFFT